MPNKFILVIYGPQCSGKSTVVKLIMEKYPEVFHASLDKIKWLISDYTAEKYSDKGTVGRLNLALARQAAAEGFSLVAEGNSRFVEEIGSYAEIADKHKIRLIRVNIEAPYGVLLDRFNLRVESAKVQKTKISVTDEQGMKERYDRYQKNKDAQIPTFDSSKMSPSEILTEIEKLL